MSISKFPCCSYNRKASFEGEGTCWVSVVRGKPRSAISHVEMRGEREREKMDQALTSDTLEKRELRVRSSHFSIPICPFVPYRTSISALSAKHQHCLSLQRSWKLNFTWCKSAPLTYINIIATWHSAPRHSCKEMRWCWQPQKCESNQILRWCGVGQS